MRALGVVDDDPTAMADRKPGAKPAGGTTTPFVRWTSGVRRFREHDDDGDRETDDRSGEGLPAVGGRGRDLRPLAGGRRLRPRRGRLDRGPASPPVHAHPAAPERDRVAPPPPRPADRGRGPDGPPRPDARPANPVPAR